MNSRLILVLVLLLPTLSQSVAGEQETDAWGPVTNNVQMCISLKGGVQSVKRNGPVTLLVRIRNTATNDTVLFYRALGEITDLHFGVSCTVISPSGRDISPDTNRTYRGGSGRYIAVQPGQTGEMEFTLSLLCKFDTVGTYRIVAKKEVQLQSSLQRFTVTSAALTVSVTGGR